MTPLFFATLLASGFFAGFMHVVSGPDHLAAMAPYAVDAKARAWRTGMRWGFGHSAGVFGVALLAFLLRDMLSVDLVSAWGERFVGVVLIGIGIWGLRTAILNGSRTDQRQPAHEHPALAVGTLHGLAGSSHFLGIVPALALPSDTAAAAYLLLFGVGSIAAMGTFSSAIGWIAGRVGSNGTRVQGLLLAICSVIAIVIGGVWLLLPA